MVCSLLEPCQIGFLPTRELGMANTKTPQAESDKNPVTASNKASAIKKILLLSFGVLVLAGGSGFGALYLTGSLGKLEHASEATVPSVHNATTHKVTIPAHTPAQYLALDPPFVVNFEDQGLLRYLQVSLSVMTRDKSIIDAVTNNMPPIRDNLILLFGSQSFEILNSTEGKEKLRNQSLANIQAILREEIGTPGVEAIYFTNFVMQ